MNTHLRIGGVVLLILLICGVFLWAQSRQLTNTTQDSPTEETINYQSATQEEKKETDSHKESIVEQDKSRSAASDSDYSDIAVFITSAKQNSSNLAVEVRGYANTFADKGKCILTLTKGSSRVETSVTAVQNVSTMSCPKLSIDRSKLSPGSWEAKLTYTSTTGQGSTIQNIELK